MQDLALTRVSSEPDTLWELVLSLHHLQCRPPCPPAAPADIAQWKISAVASLSHTTTGQRVRDHLLPLTPIASYFPDFLTPHDGLRGLEPGVEAVLATPQCQIGRELGKLATRSGTPSWGADLAAGDIAALHTLGGTLRSYFTTALAPSWPTIRARTAAEHTRLAGAFATTGISGMLSSLRPFAIWHQHDRILEASYPGDLTINLDGRGLTLIPSWFCAGTPVALADPALPPVLVYPIAHDPVPQPDPDALANLIGDTRSRVLTAITFGTPTGAIQRRVRISASQLSRHIAVLRGNNLITEARHAGQVFYTRTPLGNALIADQR